MLIQTKIMAAIIACLPIHHTPPAHPLHRASIGQHHKPKSHYVANKRRAHRRPASCRFHCFPVGAGLPSDIIEWDTTLPAADMTGLMVAIVPPIGENDDETGGGGSGLGGASGGGGSLGGGTSIGGMVGGGGLGACHGCAAPCPPVSPVPEPASWAHLIAGLALCGWSIRFRGRIAV